MACVDPTVYHGVADAFLCVVWPMGIRDTDPDESNVKRFSLDDVNRFVVPMGHVTLWWLGQAGYLVKSPGGTILAIDPYLSNSCGALGRQLGFDMDRLVPPPLAPAELVGIDLYAITHSHQDHLDPDTVRGYLDAGGTGPFLAPAETIPKLAAMGVPDDRLVMIWPNKVHVVDDVSVRATFAIPLGGDDLTHVGYLVSVEGGPTVYFTGDTGYHEVLGESIGPLRPDVMAGVINGAFRNMGPAEAARLAKELDPAVVIPCHYDLFPDGAMPPHMLRVNLHALGIADRYRCLDHAVPFTFPEGPGGQHGRREEDAG